MQNVEKITIAVVSYGGYENLLCRCVDSIVVHTSPTTYSIIVCLNQVGKKSREYIASVRSLLDTVIDSSENICIEGAITLALHACRTPWMIRLDDDSWVCRDNWLDVLKKEISVLPDSAGAIGRLHRFGGWSDQMPGQGYVSRPWVRCQPWYNPGLDDLMYQPPIGVSGGFCALNVKACLDVGYPLDSYSGWEEDSLMSLQMRMAGYTLHNSKLISEMATGADCRIKCDDPYIAIGDAPSRTARDKIRPKWKDL
jgi:hypothetical protein